MLAPPSGYRYETTMCDLENVCMVLSQWFS